MFIRFTFGALMVFASTTAFALNPSPPGSASASVNSGRVRPILDGSSVPVLTAPAAGKKVIRVTDLIVTNNTSSACQVYFVVDDTNGSNIGSNQSLDVAEIVALGPGTEHLPLMSGPVLTAGKSLYVYIQSSLSTPCPHSNPNYYDLFVFARGYLQ